MPAKAGIQSHVIPAFAGMTYNGRRCRNSAAAGANVPSPSFRSGARRARRSGGCERAGLPTAPRVVRTPPLRRGWPSIAAAPRGRVPLFVAARAERVGRVDASVPAYRRPPPVAMTAFPVRCHAREGGHPGPEREHPAAFPPLDLGLCRDDHDRKRVVRPTPAAG